MHTGRNGSCKNTVIATSFFFFKWKKTNPSFGSYLVGRHSFTKQIWSFSSPLGIKGFLNPHLLHAKGVQSEGGMQPVKVMLPCVGWAGETANGCEGCTAGLRHSNGRDWNDELSPLARTACTFLIKLTGSGEKCIFQHLGITCRCDEGGGEELWSVSDCVAF